MIASAEDAVRQIKAELMAQDWRINDRRLALLEDSLRLLSPAFQGRKSSRYIMEMARGTMRYIRKHGERSLPDALDFLKECLANLVTIYEGGKISPVREVAIFNRTYARFRKLKQKVERDG